MNDLAPASQQCWAAAATERYDVAGAVRARITIGTGSVGVDILANTTSSDALATCMTKLLMAYTWAPPLHGQTIELPFQFDAPHGQSVIDRRLVAWKGQDKVSIAVLLDEANTGNPAASMLEVAIAAHGATPARIADRPEVWYFLGPAQVIWPLRHGTDDERVAAGDMLYVPKGAAREIRALDEDVHAVLVLVPGGREGAARAGALPMRDASTTPPAIIPRVLRASTAGSFGPATIYLDDTIEKGTPLAASVLQLPGGATVPEHDHAHETELLYVLSGSGAMTIAGAHLPVTASSAIQIPPGTRHAFTAAEPVRAVQIYTPAGPEQRFKKK